MSDKSETFAALLGRAALDVWGDIPRDIQEALFETALKGRETTAKSLPVSCTTAIRARYTRSSRARNCPPQPVWTALRLRF